MSRAGFAYAQARLHARIESRFSEADWQMLASSRNFGNCLDVVNQTAAANITARLDRTNSVHAVERVLREEWDSIVNEIAEWLPAKWRSALQWLTILPHLRRCEYSPENDGIPRWLRSETEFGKASGVIWPVAETRSFTPEVAGIWRKEWCLRLPGKQYADKMDAALTPLFDRYLDNGTPEIIEPSKAWQKLVDHLTGLFRKHSQTPVAIFAYLGMVALDFERLRGILVDRIIFADPFDEGEI